jgi:hypothetical protein
MPRSRWSPIALLLLAGCTAWGGTLKVEGLPANPPPRNVFQVWKGDSLHELHGVQVEADTVRGVPTSERLDCASCAIAIAKTDVDSIRFREFHSGNTTLTTIGVFYLLLGIGALYPILGWWFGQ